MRQVFSVLLVADLALLVISYFILDEKWLVNSQVAFISSSFVMIASLYSYQSMVNRAVVAGAIADDGRDTLDKLEDPYDLYDEQNSSVDEEKSLEEVVKEERANLKKSKRSLWKTTKDAKASFSFYRLSSYAILVLGFFYLHSSNLLSLLPYLIFLSLPPLLIVFTLLKNR